MPFKRKTLSELRQENRQFMQAELESVGALLRFGNLKVLADMDAGMAHLHYAYLDYIARQSTPFTSTDEWLAGWMALKQIYRKAATAARSPAATVTGTPGKTLSKGAVLNRDDGYQYTTDDAITINTAGSASVTSLNYVCSPIERVIDFEISGISDADSATTAAIADAIDGVLFESANPLGTGKIYLSDLNRAIGDVAGTSGYILVSPSANIEPGVGELAVRGEVNYT